MVTPNGSVGAGRPRRASGGGRSRAEGAHQHDAEAEILGQGENGLLDVAFEGVVGDLHEADAAGAHDSHQLVEGGRVVVGGAENVDRPSSRSCSRRARRAGQATRLWTWYSSTRPWA